MIRVTNKTLRLPVASVICDIAKVSCKFPWGVFFQRLDSIYGVCGFFLNRNVAYKRNSSLLQCGLHWSIMSCGLQSQREKREMTNKHEAI